MNMASKFIEVKEITLEVGKEYWRESYPSNGIFLVDVSGYKALFVVFDYRVSRIGSIDSFIFVDAPDIVSPPKKKEDDNEYFGYVCKAGFHATPTFVLKISQTVFKNKEGFFYVYDEHGSKVIFKDLNHSYVTKPTDLDRSKEEEKKEEKDVVAEIMEKFKKENPLMGAYISELEERLHKKMSVQEEERKSHVFIDATLSDRDLMDRTVIMPTAEEVNEFIENHSGLIGHDQNLKLAMLLMFYWIKSR